MVKNFLVVGGSKGLGRALVEQLPQTGDTTWIVSRTRPEGLAEQFKYLWINEDLAKVESASRIKSAMGDTPLDLLIYNAAAWIACFDRMSDQAVADMINTNLTSLILMIKHLAPNLRKAPHSKVILIGSVSGLENSGSESIAYSASKFGVRGVAHSAREYFRKDAISLSCLSLGSIEPDDSPDSKLVPISDIVTLIKMITQLSFRSVPKEIDMPSVDETGV